MAKGDRQASQRPRIIARPGLAAGQHDPEPGLAMGRFELFRGGAGSQAPVRRILCRLRARHDSTPAPGVLRRHDHERLYALDRGREHARRSRARQRAEHQKRFRQGRRALFRQSGRLRGDPPQRRFLAADGRRAADFAGCPGAASNEIRAVRRNDRAQEKSPHDSVRLAAASCRAGQRQGSDPGVCRQDGLAQRTRDGFHPQDGLSRRQAQGPE